MDRKILEQIAGKYGVSPEEIQKEMKTAISAAAEKSSPLWAALFGIDNVPSCEEFCYKVAAKI